MLKDYETPENKNHDTAYTLVGVFSLLAAAFMVWSFYYVGDITLTDVLMTAMMLVVGLYLLYNHQYRPRFEDESNR